MGTGFLLAAYLYVNDCGQRKPVSILVNSIDPFCTLHYDRAK